MPPTATPGPSSQSYRNPTVEEDDDDDLDDLDDVLASFNNPQPATSSTRPATAPAPAPIPSQPVPSSGGADDDDDFEASLMQGMESLLRQLAGDHPPGPMADKPPGQTPSAPEPTGLSQPSASTGADTNGSFDEEQAWKKAVEMVLSGEGLAALGLDERGNATSENGKSPSGASPNSNGAGPTNKPAASTSTSASTNTNTDPNAKSSYEETLRKTLDSLNTAGQKPAGGDQPDIAKLLAGLGGDPDLLKNLDLGMGMDGDDDGDLADVLEGMMGQLMTKEVLEEPMAELATKYPPYLSSPPAGTTPSDLEKYTKQSAIVAQIVAVFARPDYSDDKYGKVVAGLVSDMQDLGGPPKEIMGDLPEGMDLGGLGEEGCTIM